ncbi:MAG: hypothetical protein JSV91_11575 [Phycisphaerales bacterium]|nr:MAG: hypothetical protein JSV91_11575 [Phycisphaerales bacterium]
MTDEPDPPIDHDAEATGSPAHPRGGEPRMSQIPQDRARELFFAAIDIPTERRDDFLTERCGGDEKLRAEVESLLERGAETGEFMDAPVLPPRPAGTTVSTASAHVPEQIVRYHIKRLIGSGGMASGSGGVRAAVDSAGPVGQHEARSSALR